MENMKKKEKDNFGLAFKKGWDNLTSNQQKIAKKKIMWCLGIKNDASFSKYKLGKIQMKAQQAVMLEDIFRRYFNIKDIWGK